MKADDILLRARTELMLNHPFFGCLVVQMKIIDATDNPEISTMATDGRNIFFNRRFVESMTTMETVFVLAHEVLHCALEHHLRRQARAPFWWNVAADYVINLFLTESKVGTMPKGGLINNIYKGLGAEEVYRLLEKQMKSGGGLPNGSNDPGGCGAILDGAPAHDEGKIAEARAEMQVRVRQAMAVAGAAGVGALPVELKRMIEAVLRPKVDWRAVLRRFVDESIVRDFSWARPNRRLISSGLIMPGMVGDGIPHIVIAVDTSGSIDDKVLAAFGAEINGIFGDGWVDRITVIYADARVTHIEEFEAGEELALHPVGGGGTAFSHTFKTVTEKYPGAKCCIYLTDMMVHDFGKEPPMPVLWGVYGDPRSFDQLAASAPFGEAICVQDT